MTQAASRQMTEHYPEIDGMQVGVIDPDFEVHRLLQELGDELEFSVHGFASFDEANTQSNFNHFDLLIIDINISGTNGLDALDNLAFYGCRVPLITISQADCGLLSAATAFGRQLGLNIIASLSKPINVSTLLECMRSIAEQDERLELETYFELSDEEILEAIQEQHLECLYQPKIDLHSGAVVGIEVLSRLRHEDYGLVTPDKFLPALESQDLFDRFNDQLLDTSLAIFSRIKQDIPDFQLAINFAACTIQQRNFCKQLQSAIQRYGLKPEDITIEINETVTSAHSVDVLYVLASLRFAGFNVSIDDFGTGHSPLSRFKDIPVSELKIDRYFTKDLLTDEKARAIFEMSVDIARRLKLGVVAEGIENRALAEEAKRLGATQGQGYFFAKPMDVEHLRVFLAKHRGQ